MTIHLATDHAGFTHKEALKQALLAEGATVVDHGALSYVSDDDYPDYIKPAAQAVAGEKDAVGIIFGYSGQGEAMVANRIPGVRAAVYYGEPSDGSNRFLVPQLTREHNAANMLSIGAHFISVDDALSVVKVWLNTTFSGDARHIRRLGKF